MADVAGIETPLDARIALRRDGRLGIENRVARMVPLHQISAHAPVGLQAFELQQVQLFEGHIEISRGNPRRGGPRP